MTQLPRPLYVVYRIVEMFIGLMSRGINASLLGGSTFQTTSARAYIETGPSWVIARRLINGLFFWQDGHCKAEWLREIENAEKTLRRAKGM